MDMVVEIRKGDTPEEIETKLRSFSDTISKNKKKSLNKFFGMLKLQEDPVTLQRRWRDEA